MSKRDKQNFRRNQSVNLNERKSRLTEKRSKQRKLAVVYLLLFIATGFIIFRVSTAQIANIEVTGVIDKHENERIKQITKDWMSKNGNKTFFINEKDLEQLLLEEAPSYEAFTIKTNLVNDKLVINFSVREPALIIQTDGVQYFISESGIAYAVRNDKGETDLPILLDDSNIQLSKGDAALTLQTVEFIEEINQVLAELNKPAEFYLRTGVARHIIANTRENTLIYFDMEDSLSNQLSRLKEAYQYIEKQKTNIEYIDLRSNKRAYIK